MPKFSYRGISEAGNTVSGVIEADTLEKATAMLGERGYIPSKVTKAGEGSPGFAWSYVKERLTQVKAPDLILFTKQFRTMVNAGVPILSILQVLENQTQNVKLRKVVDAMTLDIKEGSSLYDAFKNHPKIFSSLYCSMVRAGESSGALADVMERLIYIIEHEHKIKSDIKSALQYPILVVAFLAIAFSVLLTFVIPKFAQIFTNAGLTLPLPTRMSMSLYQFLSHYRYLILGAVIVGIVSLVYYFRTEQGKYVRDASVLKLPLFGSLFVKAAMARFASIFAILHASGIQLLVSIKLLSMTIGNIVIAKEFDEIRSQVEEGRGIAEPFKSSRYFTPMVINMVAIGEASGRLDEMLREVSAHYDYEVEYAMKRISDAIGPILIIGLAAVICFFALSIFLPMWDLAQIVRRG